MCTQYRTVLCNTIFLSTVLNVHVPEFQIYEEDTTFIYNNVQLCALKISLQNYMFKVRYMYENSNFILYQRVMIVPEISKVKLKKIARSSNSTPICIYQMFSRNVHVQCMCSFAHCDNKFLKEVSRLMTFSGLFWPSPAKSKKISNNIVALK